MRLRAVISSNKIRRDAKAFAARVKMSSAPLFLVVEGRVTDRAFYDRLLTAYPGLDKDGYSITLAETIELNGVSGGGKSFLLDLHEYWESSGFLAQANASGTRHIVIAADRDYDEPAGKLRQSDHIVYTQAADAEAEVLHGSDLVNVVAAVFSLQTNQVARLVPEPEVLFDQLVRLWYRWMLYGVCCIACGHGAAYACVSKFNSGGFGAVSPQKQVPLVRSLRLAAAASSSRAAVAVALASASSILSSSEGWRLVKGRWVAKYLHNLVSSSLSHEVIEGGISPDSITKAALASLDFSAQWTVPYFDQLDRLNLVSA